ncbi:KAR9-domain-containing protein [Pseudovirgaria hyperparasitica]|uniref:KAR9-domain-containing protein n=1 Tax=Pseudovirgaria hyperparasitica TaxID=470096 RepID=A0A6A6WDC0_9PEZI|nr:KAR9-domain-containing protein [Pseudovirgaria hyperparasitica]KAF2760054.1 KAR9-domain-containing protein [Pseudovirgaria hyperparasitica]
MPATANSSPEPRLPLAAAAASPPTSLDASSQAQPQHRGRLDEHLHLDTLPLNTLKPLPTPSPVASPLSDRPGSRDSTSERSRTLRRPSPGLLARMKLLDSANKARVVSSPVNGQDKIGRIPASQIRELDSFHRERAILVERRGREWTGPGTPPALLPEESETSVRSRDSTSALDTMEPAEPASIDSEQSSIISTSDHAVPSDSESERVVDNQKYRLPELEKVQSPGTSDGYFGTATIYGSGTRSRPGTAGAQDGYGTATIISNEPSRGPTPPPKDSPLVPESPAIPWRALADGGSDLQNYCNRPTRANSIYSLSRVSFTNQILQLTSINLPNSDSLAASIRGLSTSTAAGRALGEAANQIQQWIKKGAEVLNGLDAEDDVEWAAAAGREGLEEVDAAITRFEGLVEVYIGAIEELQAREDIMAIPANDLKFLVGQMEDIISKWTKIKKTLKGIKEQVEIALEWEELWNVVLGEIGMEIDALNRLVFEMEERRYRLAGAQGDASELLELQELETIVEEAPRNNKKAVASNRFSFTPAFGSNSPLLSPTLETKHEDSNLLALFARMQPLRASLDFLPMRLQHFSLRASPNFPTACGELDDRKTTLEGQWKKLEADAEALRRELGEDRWIHLFRNAGNKALTMWQSLSRSIRKLRKAFEDNADPEYIALKLRSYEEKKPHYPPAIERVLTVIERGIKDRLTINGEILRLQTDVRQKLTELSEEVKDMDAFLEDSQLHKSQQLRDSISTILSTEQSFASSALDTPGTSSASSVILSRKNSDHSPYGRKSRQTSFASSSSRADSNPAAVKRRSGLPTPSPSQVPRKTPVSRSSAVESRSVSSPTPGTRMSSSTPTQGRRTSIQPSSQSPSNKPRWSSSSNLNGTKIGHNFKPLAVDTPARSSTPTIRTPNSLRSVASHSSLPMRSPLSRSLASPPPSAGARSASTTPGQQPSSSRRTSAIAASPMTPMRRPGSALRGTLSASSSKNSTNLSGRKSSLLTPDDSVREEYDEEDEVSPTLRTAKTNGRMSSLNKRQSLLPQSVTQRSVSGPVSGRTSKLEDRPRWRGA